MLLLACLLLGLVIASLLGADLGRLAELRMRHSWSVFTSLAIQVVIFTSLQTVVPANLIAPFHVLSYAFVAVFLAANIRIAGMSLIALGWAANTTAILANGGRMPISLTDWKMAGRGGQLLSQGGIYNNNVLADHGTLTWLGDIFPLPSGIPLANAFSIGDVLIVAGAVALVSLAGRTSIIGRGLVGPLSHRPFVRLLGGRGLSQLGDWITISATVTWIYGMTGTTWWVSVFMIARLSAFLVGGAVGYRILGKPGEERFTTLLVIRGVLTAAALGVGAQGSVPGAIALLVVSAAIAPCTNAASGSLIPATVPTQILHRANALNGFILELGLVAGAAIGGLLQTRAGLTIPLAIDVATFAAAAYAFSGLAVRQHDHSAGRDEANAPATFRKLSRRLFADRAARPLVLSFVAATAGFGMLNASLPRLLSQLHEPDGYGVGMACVGGGAMLGGLLIGSMNQNRAIRRSISLGFAGVAAALALIAKSEVSTTVYLVLILIGLLDATTDVSYSTIMQQSFVGRDLPAILTLASSYISGGMIVGFTAAGLINASLPAGVAILFPAVACGVAALAALPLALIRTPVAHATRADALNASLARGLLELPALLTTPAGERVVLVAEQDGRWLAYASTPWDREADLDLVLPGYELAAHAVAKHDHGGNWLEFDAVRRSRTAA